MQNKSIANKNTTNPTCRDLFAASSDINLDAADKPRHVGSAAQIRGNILVTVLMILTILSVTTFYSARESLWAAKVSHLERDNLQLDMLIPTALAKVEQLINQLPAEIMPQSPEYCSSPCVVIPAAGNHYLTEDLTQIPAAYYLSSTNIEIWVILEYLGNNFFRSSFILSAKPQGQIHMQVTWMRTTLRSNIRSLRSS